MPNLPIHLIILQRFPPIGCQLKKQPAPSDTGCPINYFLQPMSLVIILTDLHRTGIISFGLQLVSVAVDLILLVLVNVVVVLQPKQADALGFHVAIRYSIITRDPLLVGHVVPIDLVVDVTGWVPVSSNKAVAGQTLAQVIIGGITTVVHVAAVDPVLKPVRVGQQCYHDPCRLVIDICFRR